MFKKLMEKRNQKGFTLMEMLIVVAIIAILVAIAIPVFTSQLEKAKEATDAANIRAAIADVTVAYLDNGALDTKKVEIKQSKAGWDKLDASNIGGMNLTELKVKKGDEVKIAYNEEEAAITLSSKGNTFTTVVGNGADSVKNYDGEKDGIYIKDASDLTKCEGTDGYYYSKDAEGNYTKTANKIPTE